MRRLMLVVVVLGLARSAAANNVPRIFEPFEVRLSGWSSPGGAISRFPSSIRSVPRHPDDEWLAGDPQMEEPLPDRTLPLNASTALEVAVVVHPTAYSSLGVTVAGHGGSGGGVDSRERYQQNQSGTPDRGVGASLRWYETAVGGAQVGATGSVGIPWIRVFRSGYVRAVVGGTYDITGFSYQASAGYDRWNSDEDWKTETVAHVHEHRGFGRFELGVRASREPLSTIAFLFVGPQYVRYDVRGLEGTQVANVPRDGVSVVFGVGFTPHRIGNR